MIWLFILVGSVLFLLAGGWGFAVYVGLVVVVSGLSERWRLRPFRRRRDHRDLWMNAFAPKDRWRVDVLLSAICDAFLIPQCYRFRLRPSDDIHEFYRRNMRDQLADSLEYEFMMQSLERDLGVPAVEAVSARPCTVGSLARLTAKPRTTLTAEEDAEVNRG